MITSPDRFPGPAGIPKAGLQKCSVRRHQVSPLLRAISESIKHLHLEKLRLTPWGFLQHLDLDQEEVNHRLLLAVEPTGQDDREELSGLEDEIHGSPDDLTMGK
jgi:hypothetical protein